MLAWIELAAGYGKAGENKAIEGRADPLTAVVESVIARAKENSCRGCTFQTGAAEFAELDHPVHVAALKVKEQTLARYVDYARNEGATEPERAARQVFILVEGIWAAVRLYGSNAPLEGVLDLAKLALDKS
ncbi:MAG: TetR family transcriptional regulator C-terminal domain-containing protein, partial [Notoacmeibacter sp.]